MDKKCLAYDEFAYVKTKVDYKLEERFFKKDYSKSHICICKFEDKKILDVEVRLYFYFLT